MKILRGFVVALVLCILLSPVSGADTTEEFTDEGWRVGIVGVTAMTAIDINSNGKLEGVIVGDSSGVYGVDEDGQLWKTSISLVKSLASIDYDDDGYLDEIIVGSSKKVYVLESSNGNILGEYPINSSVSSVAAIDLDNDGNLDEILVGAWGGLYALDSINSISWSNEDLSQIKLVAAADFDGDGVPDDAIASSGNYIYEYDSDGTSRGSKSFSDIVNSIGVASLDGDSKFDDVIVATLDGSVTALAPNRAVRWIYNVTPSDERPPLLIAADLNSDGAVGEILIRSNGIYAVDSDGGKLWRNLNVYPNSFAVADFDGDGKLDDVIVGESSKIKAVTSETGDVVGTYESGGADHIIAADLDGDGIVDDVVAARESDLTLFALDHKSTAPPTTPSGVDSDGDTVPDSYDICPNEYGPPATNGCPDKDFDMVPDKYDLCPDEVGSVNASGCPDANGNGVPDKFEEAGNKPPSASIIYPIDGSKFTQGKEIEFKGSGTDSDGTITKYSWTSSLDGDLGTGRSFNSSALSLGTHIITLTVTDDKGATGTASVTLSIGSEAGAQPVEGEDSDGDGLTDEQEKIWKTNPYNPDTDGDGIIDSLDPNPLQPSGKGFLNRIYEKKWNVLAVVLVIVGIAVYFLKKRSEGEIGLQEW